MSTSDLCCKGIGVLNPHRHTGAYNSRDHAYPDIRVVPPIDKVVWDEGSP